MTTTGPNFRLVILLVGLTQLIVTTDFSIVAVALPSIGRQLHIRPASLSWVISASALKLFAAQQIGVPLGATLALSVLGAAGAVSSGLGTALFRDGYLTVTVLIALRLVFSFVTLRPSPTTGAPVPVTP